MMSMDELQIGAGTPPAQVTDGQQQAFAKIDDLFSGLAEGRIVHYVMADGRVRPLLVLRVWDRNIGYLNGLLFFDGSNDIGNFPRAHQEAALETQGIKHTHLCVAWITSVSYSATPLPDTWHWPVASAAKGDATAMAQIAAVLDEHMKSVESRLALHIQTVNQLLDSHSDMVRDAVTAVNPKVAHAPLTSGLTAIGDAATQAAIGEQQAAEGSGSAEGKPELRQAEGSPKVATDIPSAETNGN